MVHFIRDIRKHLGKKKLPIVIGVAGHGGDKPNEAGEQLRAAQSAPAEMEEFKGTVAAVPTAPFWDPEPHGDGGYHYNGSASFYYDAGAAFGETMLKLLEVPVSTFHAPIMGYGQSCVKLAGDNGSAAVDDAD